MRKMTKYKILLNAAEDIEFSAKNDNEAKEYFRNYIMKEKEFFEGDIFRCVKQIGLYDVDDSRMEFDL